MSEKRKAASREDLKKLKARRYDFVDLPLGQSVRIRSLTELEKSDYESELIKKKGTGVNMTRLRYARQRLIMLTAVDDEGRLLYNSDDAVDLEDINAMDGAMTAMIFDKVRSHCGFEPDDIENLVKNSEETLADDSPTS